MLFTTAPTILRIIITIIWIYVIGLNPRTQWNDYYKKLINRSQNGHISIGLFPARTRLFRNHTPLYVWVCRYICDCHPSILVILLFLLLILIISSLMPINLQTNCHQARHRHKTTDPRRPAPGSTSSPAYLRCSIDAKKRESFITLMRM